jgi:prepilin-type N-terminal cleavage/methylation domain-containing protein
MLEMMKAFFCRLLSCRRPRQERGFTLWEIMVVLLIIGLVVAIGYPMVRRSLVRARLLSQAGVLKQACAVARAAALRHGDGVVLLILEANAVQHGGEVVAWVDDNSNGAHDSPAEIMIGKWPISDKISLKPDPDHLLFKPGGTTRGGLFLGNGTAISNASGSVGIGQGAVVVSDRNQNEVRLLIMAGTGTVVQEMWDPGSGTWSDEMRFWRY